MSSLYVVEQGSYLNIRSQRLLVHKKGELIVHAPLAHTDTVVFFGNIEITTPAIKRLMAAGIDLIFLSSRGKYVGRIIGPASKFGELRQHQHALAGDPDFCLEVAQRIVSGKLLNMRTLLMRYNRELRSDTIQRVADMLARQAGRIPLTTGLEQLMGMEGSGSAAYFSVFGELLQHGWRFRRRLRRPPPDPVNVLLSLGYTLLTQMVESCVELVGLDPYLGLLHAPRYGKPSLALDLVEEFRAIIVDSVVLRCLNRQLITPADFTHGETVERPVVLSQEGIRQFIRAFETRLDTEVVHPETGHRVTYRRVFELQTRMLARCFKHAEPGYRPFKVR